jgi:hypothetical protein
MNVSVETDLGLVVDDANLGQGSQAPTSDG